MSTKPIHKTDDVFGIARELPLNYVTRDGVDGALLDNLTRDRHIVIYGGSKQGKTCLRKHVLGESDYINVTCSNKWTLGQLHASILKQAGYVVEQSATLTVSGQNKVSAKVAAKVGVQLIGEIGGEIAAENVDEKERQIVEKAIELDPFDVNDIIAALNEIEFSEYIVLEDFHYLPEDTQKDFAVALKAFHEDSKHCFVVVVVGVWRDENRLIQYNGDLTGRVVTINADEWSESELRQVVEKGEKLLNITFDRAFVDGVITGCFDSVYVVQESCHRACTIDDVRSTQVTHRVVGTTTSAEETIGAVIAAQTARYHSFIDMFSGGFMESSLEMYRWLLYPILTAESKELEKGLRYNAINKILKSKHPSGAALKPGNLTGVLKMTAALQIKRGIKPIILDYSGLVLTVVDRGFLIWLSHQKVADLLEMAGLPQVLTVDDA